MIPEYEAVIGLETHIQLKTKTKIFCSCSADSWNDEQNTNICPVCSGLPGVLPVLNKKAVEKGVLLARAMNSTIQPISFFDRKNYFYPDLPKGYQITQYDKPFGKGGYLDLPASDGSFTRVNIAKMHLEEDAGKTKNDHNERLIDFNRCGVPLVEMVTEPDIRTADDAADYLTRLRQLLRWVGISDADMEKGQLRCDANVSIRLKGETHLNQKTEIKNVNSIEAVRSAIEAEIERQVREVEAGNRIESWTLEWDDENKTLKKMRSKETEADYRYFKEPDLLPLIIDKAWLSEILFNFPELPLERRARFIAEYGLLEYDAEILSSERQLSEYFIKVANTYKGDLKRVANWLTNDVLRMIKTADADPLSMPLTPEFLAEIISMVDAGMINTTIGKELLLKVQECGISPAAIVEKEGLGLVNDNEIIEKLVDEIIACNPKEVGAYKNGKLGLIGFFVGQLMKQVGGKADAKLAKELFEQKLN